MRLNRASCSLSSSLPSWFSSSASKSLATLYKPELPLPLLSSSRKLIRDASTGPSSKQAAPKPEEAPAAPTPALEVNQGPIRVTDKRSNAVDMFPPHQDFAKIAQVSAEQSNPSAPEGEQQQSNDSMGSPSNEDLLKQRFYHVQAQNKQSSTPGSFKGDTTIIPPESHTAPENNWTTPDLSGLNPPPSQPNTGSSSSSSQDGAASATSEFANHDPRTDLHAPAQSVRSLEVPFDTHAFVRRLEQGGWASSHAGEHDKKSFKSQAKSIAEDEHHEQDLGLQLARRHDPAEAIMEKVRFLITRRGRQTAYACLNKGDVENQAYLFSAALSELQTEVQIRAKNDAAALRSITILLQREVDALEQKMKEDVERLKHDIQVDMNNRKAESKEEQNNLEQEIQDLNNRFTISLSDLKTEIEQNVKWDATRRSLFLVFGIAAIVAANLAIADYLTRDDDVAKAAAAKELANTGTPPDSANAAAPASLSWSAEGRMLSAWPVLLLSSSMRFRVSPAVARSMTRAVRFSRPATVASVGLYHSLRKLSLAPSEHEPREQHCPRQTSWAGMMGGAGLLGSRRLHTGNKSLQATPVSSSPPEETSFTIPETDLTISLHPSSVSIHSSILGIEPFHFDHVWLRDACQSEGSIHASNKQKLFHTSDVPLDVSLLDAANPPELVIKDSANGPEHVLRLTFAKEQQVHNAFTATFGEVKEHDKAHVSDFPISFLLHHAVPELYAHTHMDIMSVPQPWEAKDLSHFKSQPWSAQTKADPVESSIALALGAMARPARIPWEAICPVQTQTHGEMVGAKQSAIDEARSEALYTLTEATLHDGFAFVTGLPTVKTSTEPGPDSASLHELVEMMGEIRHTFYGPMWDVQSKVSSNNIAYTNLDLGLHMDLLYFQNPPRFQFLHMLRKKVRGGTSIFVDSFKVAERMWEEDKEQWHLLAKVPVGFHYVNDGRHYRFTHPTFELAHDTEGHAGPPLHGSSMPRLSAINYSPPFQSPLPLHPTPHLRTPEDRAKFYAALKRFADLTLQPKFIYEKNMEEGECVIFDNRRVLHSRKGFEWNESEVGEVKRWLKGCYMDGDAIWSTYRTLRTKLGGGGAGARGVPTSGRTATNLSGRRSFSTSTRNGAISIDAAKFAPSSNDPTVTTFYNAAPLNMSSYRPVPPLTTNVFKQLAKSRLTFLVVLTGMAGYALCPSALTVAVASPITTLLALTVGMTLCSTAANTLNQLVEAPYDAQMPRTRARPLPSRAVTPLHAFSFAALAGVSGITILGSMVNPLTAALGAANILLYSFTYTPMKRMSIANTWVGAVVGALPPLMGWAACTGTLHQATDLGGWALAFLLFAWQFPHFNSLAHTLRAEYARGGYRMMAVTNPGLNRRVSLRYAVALLPICTLLLPYSGVVHPVAYAVFSTPLNLAMAHAAWKFYGQGTQKTAKWCFWVSLIHLPAVMLLAMGCKPGLWDGLAQRFREAEEKEEKEQV